MHGQDTAMCECVAAAPLGSHSGIMYEHGHPLPDWQRAVSGEIGCRRARTIADANSVLVPGLSLHSRNMATPAMQRYEHLRHRGTCGRRSGTSDVRKVQQRLSAGACAKYMCACTKYI